MSTTRRYALPVASVRLSYARTHHDYPAADIFAACGSPVVAVTDGVVDDIERTDSWVKSVDDPTTRGGLYVSLRGDDGVRYYAAHLQEIDPALVPGTRVQAAQALGTVGRTGDTSACHVHFGISPNCPSTAWWVRRGTIWPWRYLDSWRTGGERSPAPEVAAWSEANPQACDTPNNMPWPSRER